MSHPDTPPRPARDSVPASDGRVLFAALDGALAAVDAVEGYRYTLATSPGVAPEAVDTDAFPYPVDAAVRVRTDHLETRNGDVPAVYVRDADWRLLAETDPPTDRTFPADEYYLEICAPVKLFVHVEGGMTVTATTSGKRIAFDDERTVAVGAFSKHDQPAATVTTTAAPRDVMAAVSTFGSALKTTSPERSFPNQRGHPPAVELGDSLSVPDGLERPATGVTVEVPPELRYVYPVAPLAYYLGAAVEPGERPRLVTDRGFAYDLARDGRFERTVARVLQGTFLLDCVTRTEGLYPVDLAEREALEPLVDLPFAALYDRPLAERLEAYLSVPYETLAPHVPDWKLTADLAARPDTVETLPFVVDDLAVVRTDAASGPASSPGPRRSEVTEAAAAIDGFVRSSRETAATASPPTVDLPAADSLEQTWVGDGVLSGASKGMAAAYRNRMERSASTGDIDVTVVCNDRAMMAEHDAVEAVYGPREDTAIDLSVATGATTAELRDLLGGDADFLHYIGHIDDQGFGCTDGYLDARTLDSTGIGTFLLNACTSYDQGVALIEAGAVGGIVTLTEVYNEPAESIGSTVARLLDAGYPLRPAMNIARRTAYSSGTYVVVGDGSTTAVKREDCIPNLYEIERDGEAFRLTFRSYLSVRGGMGDIITVHLEDADRYYLGAGALDTFSVTAEELRSFLPLDEVPIVHRGDLYWPAAFVDEHL